MTPRTKRGSVTVLVVSMLATIAMLSAHGWDVNKKFVSISTCTDLNGDTSKDELPGTQCLEGHSCIFCNGDNTTGYNVSSDGSGSGLFRVENVICEGDRLLGTCTGNGGLTYCDLTPLTVTGTCNGFVITYEPQGQEGF